MKDFFVYILKCRDGSYYVGHTDDIERRIAEHQEGLAAGYTSSRLPIHVVYTEVCASRDEALDAERKLKKWSRKKKKILITKGWQAMKGCWRTIK